MVSRNKGHWGKADSIITNCKGKPNPSVGEGLMPQESKNGSLNRLKKYLREKIQFLLVY